MGPGGKERQVDVYFAIPSGKEVEETILSGR